MSARVKAAKNAAVRCRCRGCHHDLGMYRWTATAPDDGRFVEVVAGERMSFGTPARRGERTGTGLFVEVFEGRVYQRIRCAGCRRDEKVAVANLRTETWIDGRPAEGMTLEEKIAAADLPRAVSCHRSDNFILAAVVYVYLITSSSRATFA